jgi:hypothetical protein
MNVAAALASKNAYERSVCGTFNGVLKHQFAATTRTRLMMDMGKLHAVLHVWEEVRNRGQTVQIKKRYAAALAAGHKFLAASDKSTTL